MLAFTQILKTEMGQTAASAIVNVNEHTYRPEIERECKNIYKICEIIPIMLNGMLMPNVDSIKRSNL